MLALKPDTNLAMNRNLKVLDLSYNNFSGSTVQEFQSVFEQNRSLEFLGLAKNRLTTEDILPILDSFKREYRYPILNFCIGQWSVFSIYLY